MILLRRNEQNLIKINLAAMNNNRLPKNEIANGHRLIRAILHYGKLESGSYVSLYHLGSNNRSVGFIVAKQCRKSVQRNKQKRRMRELYRKNKNIFPEGKILLCAKYGVKMPTYQDYYKDIMMILKRNTCHD